MKDYGRKRSPVLTRGYLHAVAAAAPVEANVSIGYKHGGALCPPSSGIGRRVLPR